MNLNLSHMTEWMLGQYPTNFNKSLKHRTFGAGQFLSRAFVVLLRKKYSTKSQLKNCRLARRYVGQEIKKQCFG